MSADSQLDGPPSPWETTITPRFLDDLDHWITHERRTAQRVTMLMRATARDPFTGTGKPEALKHLGPGVWSRRIIQEHRLVYLVDADAHTVRFLQARYHYQP